MEICGFESHPPDHTNMNDYAVYQAIESLTSSIRNHSSAIELHSKSIKILISRIETLEKENESLKYKVDYLELMSKSI